MTVARGTPLSALAIGRYPAPVWTMMAWSSFSGLNLLFAITFPPNNKPPDGLTVSVCVYALLIVGILLVLGPRTPSWLLWVMLAGAMLSTAALVYAALTPLGLALFALPFIIYCSYAALWGTLRMALGVLVASALLYAGVLVARDALPYLLVGWVLMMTICTGLVLLLHYLVADLRRMASIDALTGLLNRAGLQTLLDLGPSKGRRTEPRSVVVMDLDGLKTLNDSQGHQAGDDAIRDFAQALRSTARSDDILARTGGDEFVAVLPATRSSDAEAFVRRLQQTSTVAWSHGVAQWTDDLSYDEVIARADALMYEAKRRKRL